MKRIAVWIMYAVGVFAIGYLALFVYVTHTGRTLQPGKPIQIFRNPDAPSYSWNDGNESRRHGTAHLLEQIAANLPD